MSDTPGLPALEMSNGSSGAPTRPLTLLERLRLCQPAWAPGGLWDREGIRTALWGRQTGSFLVLIDSASQPQLLCVSVGGDRESVRDFPIQQTGTVFHLSQSHLAFSDLVQLVAFYTLSRDVLPVCLFIPPSIFRIPEQIEHILSSLGPKFWLCPSPDTQPTHMTTTTFGLSMCSIQVTSASGALCIINPLYLHEHGDNWLMERLPPHVSPPPTGLCATYKRERRLSTARPWGGAGLCKLRSPSLDQEPRDPLPDGSVLSCAQPPPSHSAPVVLRRASKPLVCDSFKRWEEKRSDGTSDEAMSQCGPVPPSPHRVSWIEDRVGLSPPPPPSLLQPPCLELDSLSISSIEEEPDSTTSPAHNHTHHLPLVLADKVKHRLSAVGLAIGGLMSPKKRLTNRALELSERRGSAFAEGVRAFKDQILKGGASAYPSATELLQEVRTTLTNLREALLNCVEMQVLIDSLGDTSDWELDAILELSIHKVALKPVRAHLYACLHNYHGLDGSLQKLKDNQHSMEEQGMEGLGGAAGVGLPDAVTLEKIQQRWASMHQAYSPSTKVQILLKVCKSIYHSMSANASAGAVFGADDFLPCLTWVVLRSDVNTLQLDIDYMMELLDPTQLQGEGGYYLTSLYASLFHINSFCPRLAARQLSTDAQRSLSQWHRRRTLHSKHLRGTRSRRTLHRPADGGTGYLLEEMGSEDKGPKETVVSVAGESCVEAGQDTAADGVDRPGIGKCGRSGCDQRTHEVLWAVDKTPARQDQMGQD